MARPESFTGSRARLSAVPESPAVSDIADIVADVKQGKMVILVDEEDRENEGDLILAADFVSAEHINFMAREGRGLICLTLTEDRCLQLNLPLMVERNRSSHGTNFTVSIEAAEGVTTGISAQDRAQTVKAAVAHGAKPSDLVQPGHIFPLMAQNGGVLMRAGHTEAGCDLAAMAGLTPATVICEILKDDGTMARLPDLVDFGHKHGIKIGTIAALIHYRSRHESLILRAGERDIDTGWQHLPTKPSAGRILRWCWERFRLRTKPWCECTSRFPSWTFWTADRAHTAGASIPLCGRSRKWATACWCF